MARSPGPARAIERHEAAVGTIWRVPVLAPTRDRTGTTAPAHHRTPGPLRLELFEVPYRDAGTPAADSGVEPAGLVLPRAGNRLGWRGWVAGVPGGGLPLRAGGSR